MVLAYSLASSLGIQTRYLQPPSSSGTRSSSTSRRRGSTGKAALTEPSWMILRSHSSSFTAAEAAGLYIRLSGWCLLCELYVGDLPGAVVGPTSALSTASARTSFPRPHHVRGSAGVCGEARCHLSLKRGLDWQISGTGDPVRQGPTAIILHSMLFLLRTSTAIISLSIVIR